MEFPISGDPFGSLPPWQRPLTGRGVELLNEVLASDWPLPPGIWQRQPVIDRAWAEVVLERLIRYERYEEADVLRCELRRQGMKRLPVVEPPLLRSVHHLACTGGTLISKVIASLPGVTLLSEVNPGNRSSAGFHPSDPLLLLEQSTQPLPTEEVRAAFLADMAQAVRICTAADRELVLRDHSHSDFCRGRNPLRSGLLLSWLQYDYRFRSLLTLRHPLDSWLGLVNAGWHKQFEPSTLAEYCRRQSALLDATEGMPWLSYEAFCTDPVAELEWLCDALLLPFDPGALDRFGAMPLCGDSGRRRLDRIELPPRRQIPEWVQAELKEPATQRALAELCDLLGYPVRACSN